MALIDFKRYMFQLEAQYVEMKNDLIDFEKALKDGYITEDQLESVKEDVDVIEQNYKRLLYAAFLLEIPKRNSKKAKYKAANKAVIDYFEALGAGENAVIEENKSLITNIRAELKKLQKNQNKTDNF